MSKLTQSLELKTRYLFLSFCRQCIHVPPQQLHFFSQSNEDLYICLRMTKILNCFFLFRWSSLISSLSLDPPYRYWAMTQYTSVHSQTKWKKKRMMYNNEHQPNSVDYVCSLLAAIQLKESETSRMCLWPVWFVCIRRMLWTIIEKVHCLLDLIVAWKQRDICFFLRVLVWSCSIWLKVNVGDSLFSIFSW